MLVELHFRPEPRQLRQFGFIALAAFGILGALIFWKGGLFGFDFGPAAGPLAITSWLLGISSAMMSALWPRGNRPLFVLLSLAAFPVGFVVSHLVLAILFFGVLTPAGLLMRLLGRDPLERKFDEGRKSYWVDLPEPKEPRDYFRQF